MLCTLQRCTAQGLRQQIKAQRRAQQTLRLAVQHRYVFIALGRWRQFTGGIQFADTEGNATLARNVLFKQAALRAKYPWCPGISTGMQQQRFGETVELVAGHLAGIDEETLQAAQALFLVFKTFLDAAVALVDQQLEPLAHLLLI